MSRRLPPPPGRLPRGKYLDQYRAGTNLVLLAPDVRVAFPTDQSVNEALRSIMQHGPAER
ncbi:MAG: hypothetical protein RBS80_02050 [Thermoguttaceae bacterium]|jgi:hypothetical protein|nr:hypothetical protein [Thermoguttaceae bacterium]